MGHRARRPDRSAARQAVAGCAACRCGHPLLAVVARNGSRVDEPLFRDTVLIHPREDIDIGLVPADAGTRMMHCHILEHAEAGMMTTIAVRVP